MTPPSRDLDGARVIQFAILGASICTTAATLHFKNGELLPAPAAVAICQYPGNDEYYLFYCDENWNVATDTLHPTIAAAMEQAEFEFAGISSAWQNCD